jgi:hypothetical protein
VPGLRAAIAVGVVFVLPGLLIVAVARVRLTLVEWFAVAPVCSLGAVYVLAEVLTLAGVPFGPAAFVVMLAALSAGAVLRMRNGWRPPPFDHDDDTAITRGNRKLQRRGVLVATGLLVLAITVGGITWLVPMRNTAVIPPGIDAISHGIFVRRIADTESIKPRDVFVMDANGKQSTGVKYYPLALHASVAIAYRITGTPIGVLLNAVIVFFAALVLPLGLFALVRLLLPDEPVAAGFAAILGSLITMFPYQPAQWGLIPLIAGVALIPISVVLLVRTVTREWSVAAAVLSGLVVAGGFALHNSEVPLTVLLTGLVLLFRDGLTTGSLRWRDAVTRLAWIGLAAAAFLAPTLPQVVAGGTERSAHGSSTGPVGSFLRDLVTLRGPSLDRQTWLSVLAAAGVVLLLVRRQARGWIAGALVVITLAVLANSSDDPVTRALTFPWYRDAFRINYNVTLFVAVFGGVLLGVISRWCAQRVSARSWALPVSAGLVLLVLLPLGAWGALRKNRDRVSTWYSTEAPVGAPEVAAFKFLRQHERPGDSVLSDASVDAAGWMYPIAGANPLFGIAGGPHSWDERYYLHDLIGKLGADQTADAIVRRLRVRFVYFSEQGMRFMGPHKWTLAGLRATPHLTEIFNDGDAHVLEIDPAFQHKP